MFSMMAQGICLIFIVCICVSHGNSFTFPRLSNRRPRTRLFGTSRALSAAPTRYSMEPKRPSVRPFRIPGFERSQASMTGSRASRLGFDLGLGGRALSDPIASMYDSAGGVGGSRLSYVNGVGDIGGFDSLGGGGDLYGGSLGFNDGLITAANSRDLKMIDINSAGSRLRQPIDIGSYGNQMISSSSGLGGSGVASNQGQMRNFDLNYDTSGGIGGGSQYLMSNGGGRQQAGLGLNQASLDQQSGQLLGGSGGSANIGGQLGLGSNTWIGLDSNDFRTNSGNGLGFSSNQIGGLGGSNSLDLSLNSGVNQYGMSSYSNGQLSTGLDSNQVDLGLTSLGSNQVGLGTSQMNTLDLSTNQFGGGMSGQQGFLNQGTATNNMATVGSNGNTLNAQLGQSQMGMSSGNQLSTMAVQNSVGGGVGGSSLSNQVSSNGFGNSLGMVGSSLSGDSLSAAAVPTQGTLTASGQYMSTSDGQVINIGHQGDTGSQYQASGALSNSPPASPMSTAASPSSGQYTASSRSNFGQTTSEQGNFGHTSHDGHMSQFSAASNTGMGQLSATATDMGQMASSGTNLGQFSAGGRGGVGGQFASGQGTMFGQLASSGNSMEQLSAVNGLGQLPSQDQNLVVEKNSGGGFSSSANGMGQFSLGSGDVTQLAAGGNSVGQISQGGDGLGQFVSMGGQISQGSEGTGQFSQGFDNAGQFSQAMATNNQFSQGVANSGQLSQSLGGTNQFSQGLGGANQFSQGLSGANQFSQDTSKSGQFISGGEGANQFLLDSGQVGRTSQSNISPGLNTQSSSQNILLSQQFSGTGESMNGVNGGSASMLKR